MNRPAEPATDPTAARLLDAAARVFAERGRSAGMAEVAEAAGVGRATLYRYFPNRDALLTGLITTAAAEVERLIADADIHHVDVREGLSRLCRGFMTAGARFAFLAGLGDLPEKDPGLERRLAEPLLALLQRGIAEGALRGDLPAETLLLMFTGLVSQGLRLLNEGETGPERASAAVIGLFLDGAARH